VYLKDERPDTSYRRGLLFPGGTAPPRFEWVRIVLKHGGDTIIENVEAGAYLGDHEKDNGGFAFNTIQGRDITRGLSQRLFWYKNNDTVGAAMPLNLGYNLSLTLGLARRSSEVLS
jgi:hypothetical protein